MALGEFEQLVMLAILHLDNCAYGVEIVDTIKSRIGRSVSRSSLHITFDRLEKKGLIGSDLRGGDRVRGGHARRYVSVSPQGVAALRESQAVLAGMARGLGHVLEGAR